jgi:hypothetical protein
MSHFYENSNCKKIRQLYTLNNIDRNFLHSSNQRFTDSSNPPRVVLEHFCDEYIQGLGRGYRHLIPIEMLQGSAKSRKQHYRKLCVIWMNRK